MVQTTQQPSLVRLAEAKRVTIWSDVAGVYSADPRLVSDACLLPLLRLDEASELARLAAPVLHSRTLQPVAQSAMDLAPTLQLSNQNLGQHELSEYSLQAEALKSSLHWMKSY